MPYDRELSEAWLTKLGTQLDARALDIKTYHDYYEGKHDLLFASKKFRSAFGGLFNSFADNFCFLVVDAVQERLNVQGFRVGGSVDDASFLKGGDDDAWAMWQRNHLDADSKLAHNESLTTGYAYVLVWADQEGRAKITVEDPSQVIIGYAPGTRRQKRVAMKRWVDESGFMFATLYYDDRIEKYKSTKKVNATSGMPTGKITWEPREEADEQWPLPNPLGEVPVVQITNMPKMNGAGISELKNVIPAQDAVNKLCADMLVASEFGAFRQRWATGIDIPINEETGEPIEPFQSAIDRLWATPGDKVQFGEFGQTDLQPYVAAIEMFVQHLATTTRTPPHYLMAGQGTFPSGESLKSAESGLVAKVRDRMIFYGEDWEEVIRLGFLAEGDPRGKVDDSEVIWADPESRTESQHVDAVTKKSTLGVPQEVLWEELGYSPQQIKRMKIIREQERLEGLAGDPFGEEPETPEEPA